MSDRKSMFLAPPAGVEPTTYRLGGGSLNSSLDDEFEDIYENNRLILSTQNRANYTKKIDSPASLLDSFWVFWLGLILSLAMIGFSIFSLIRNPPVPPPEYANCPAHDPGNPWCIR